MIIKKESVMIYRKLNTLLLSISFLVLLSCDVDKYFMSSLELNTAAGDSTYFMGMITREDTGEEIEEAVVRIGYSFSLTDSTGQYRLDIPITGDDNRNSLTPLVVAAHNYLTHFGYEYVTPLPETLDVALVYAAPIFENVAFEDQAGRKIFHAWMKDFEGAEDVKEVLVNIMISRSKEINISLHRIEITDKYRSYWKSDPYFGELSTGGYGAFYANYIARDFAGHEEIKSVRYVY